MCQMVVIADTTDIEGFEGLCDTVSSLRREYPYQPEKSHRSGYLISATPGCLLSLREQQSSVGDGELSHESNLLVSNLIRQRLGRLLVGRARQYRSRQR